MTSKIVREREERYKLIGWANLMPSIPFKSSWKVTIVPPYAGAAVRFWVDRGGAHVSVFADFDGSIGCEDAPYWEIYPINDSALRLNLNDGDTLCEKIEEALQQQES